MTINCIKSNYFESRSSCFSFHTDIIRLGEHHSLVISTCTVVKLLIIYRCFALVVHCPLKCGYLQSKFSQNYESTAWQAGS